jgi:phage antirepressor YoqD-like protein
MNELIIKEVEFNGDSLIAIQSNIDNKIYVSINHVCNALGLDARKQRNKIQDHMTLSKGCTILGIPTNSGTQNTIMLEVDFLPLWLAGVNPSKVNDNVVDKLIEYQLKAKDILANAFIPKEFQTPKTLSEALFLASNQQKLLEEYRPKVEAYDEFISSEGLYNFKQVAGLLHYGRNKLMRELRQAKVLCGGNHNKNLPYSQYQNFFEIKISPRKTSDGLVSICTTLCKPNGIELIRTVLQKRKALPPSKAI